MKKIFVIQDCVVAGVPSLKRGVVRRLSDDLADSLVARGLALYEGAAKKDKELEAAKQTDGDAPASITQKGGKKSNNL